MRTLELQIVKSKEKHIKLKYSVFIYRGTNLKFSCLRTAQDFVRNFQTNVNDCLRSLNLLMSDLYKKYLDFYFFMDSIKCSRIKNSVDAYNDRLHYFFKDFGNGNQSFKITAFYSLFDHLKELIAVLSSYARKSKNYQLLNSLNSNLKTIDLLLSHFNNSLLNKEVSTHYKKRVLHISYEKPLSMA